MARIYSTNFIRLGGAVPDGYRYTVPDGFVAVITDMSFTVANNEVTSPFWVIVNDPESGQMLWALNGPIMNYLRTYQWKGREVFQPGGIIQVTYSITAATFSANGYLLVTP